MSARAVVAHTTDTRMPDPKPIAHTSRMSVEPSPASNLDHASRGQSAARITAAASRHDRPGHCNNHLRETSERAAGELRAGSRATRPRKGPCPRCYHPRRRCVSARSTTRAGPLMSRSRRAGASVPLSRIARSLAACEVATVDRDLRSRPDRLVGVGREVRGVGAHTRRTGSIDHVRAFRFGGLPPVQFRLL